MLSSASPRIQINELHSKTELFDLLAFSCEQIFLAFTTKLNIFSTFQGFFTCAQIHALAQEVSLALCVQLERNPSISPLRFRSLKSKNHCDIWHAVLLLNSYDIDQNDLACKFDYKKISTAISTQLQNGLFEWSWLSRSAWFRLEPKLR